MKWKIPPRLKVYEALGCLADQRITLVGDGAVVTSSSGHKKYRVRYDPQRNAITSNDNGSYWQGYLGYPAISFFLATGMLRYDKKTAVVLKGIAWKDINRKFKNDFAKTESFILNEAITSGAVRKNLESEVARIMQALENLSLQKLGTTLRPPQGY